MPFSRMRVAIAALLASAGLQAAEPASIADFVKHPAYSAAKISPNGEYLAITVDIGEQDVLTVLRMKDLSVVKVNRLPDNRSVGAFYWTSPERLLFSATRKIGSFEQPMGTGEWFAVNADGSYQRPLIYFGARDVTQRSKTVAGSYSLLDTLRDDDDNVAMVVYTARSSEGAGAEVELMDTVSGRRKSLGRAPKANCSISLDAGKQPRYAVCSTSRDENGEFDEQNELFRRDDGGNWTLLNSSKADGKFLQVFATSEDGTVYATQSDGKAPAALGILDPETGAFRELFRDPVANISDTVWSSDGKRILAVATAAGAPQVELIDGEHADAALYKGLAQAFEGQVVDFGSATRDGKQIVVSVHSDTNPGELYLYNRDTGQARFLMKNRAWVEPARMGKVVPFSFAARDGRMLHGYLTLPPGSAGKNLPMIVNPHGGPIGPRDDWAFNSEAQLLASRGYAVLKVNFRGSGGYGKAFQDAGHMQWADGIQDDIIDATRWAIGQGYANKDRVCIYGGSFGGYSSLMAPIRAPGMFKCAFGYVGVYDMPMMFEKGDIPERESGQRYLRKTLGTDEAGWARMSPTARAAEVKIPVFLAAGALDRRAVPEQTKAMAAALKAAGNPPEGMIIQEGEMHGFYKEENRIALYTAMLDFFRRHIGAGTVAAP